MHCVGRLRTISEGGNTIFVDAFAIAVSSAAGASTIVVAKHGLSVQAVGGVGEDFMDDWVLQRRGQFVIDIKHYRNNEARWCPPRVTLARRHW